MNTVDHETTEKSFLPSNSESSITTMSFCRSRSSFSKPIWLESCDHKRMQDGRSYSNDNRFDIILKY